MSHFATAWAIRQRGLKPATKIVLFHLADRHNPDQGCFPSQKTLAEDCEMSERSVRDHLDILEERGLIKRSNGHSGGEFKSNRYWLACEPDFPPTAKSADGENASLPTAKFAADRRQNLPTNLVREPCKEPIPPLSPKGEKPRQRKCSLPPDWIPNDRNIEDAQARQFSAEEITHEAAQFRDYHLAKASTFADWDAAWRTWLGNARKFAAQRPRNASRGNAYDALLAGFQSAADRRSGGI